MQVKDQIIKESFAALDKALSLSPFKLALAVSGGADSVFMLRVVDLWARQQKTSPELHIITIDHDLRESSSADAKFAYDAARSLGHKAKIIKWQHDKIKSGVQEAARRARYDLLERYCSQHDIYHLLTAHNGDDFLEDFVMSAKRTQLALPRASHNIFFLDKLKIIRPLYDIASQDIRDYLRARKIEWVEDETNKSPDYERSRVRSRLCLMDDREMAELKMQIKNVEDRAQKNQSDLIVALAEAACISKYGFASLDKSRMSHFNMEVKIHLLAYILTIIGGNKDTPRLTSVEKLLQNIDARQRHTLHNCNIIAYADHLLIYREFGKSPPASVASANLWDNRFICRRQIPGIIDFAGDARAETIDKNKILDCFNNELAGFKMRWQDAKNILYTIPVVKSLEKSAFKYHIRLEENFMRWCDVFHFTPVFRSRFTHFISKI